MLAAEKENEEEEAYLEEPKQPMSLTHLRTINQAAHISLSDENEARTFTRMLQEVLLAMDQAARVQEEHRIMFNSSILVPLPRHYNFRLLLLICRWPGSFLEISSPRLHHRKGY